MLTLLYRAGTVLSFSLLFAAAAAGAQPLTSALCPVPPVGNFNLHPTFVPFVAGDPGIPLLRRTIDTNLYPEARCNDGSPAVMYIRPANAAYACNPIVNPSTKWLIFLDGGGACRDADSCLLERWCSGGGQIFDRAGKMSSLDAPPAIHGNGIWNLAPGGGLTNHFQDYNHVLVHYCSSDNWVGSAKHTGLNTSTGIGYDIQFQGEAIVEAVLATLANGPIAADPQAVAAFYGTTIPNLQGAREVGLGGESAGGGGLRHHLDKINFDRLRLMIADPNVVIWAVVDAGTEPGLWDAGVDWSDPYSPADYSDYLLTQVEPPIRSFWGANNSALDRSCLDPAWAAQHQLDGLHPQICYDTTYTLLNHITTPVFLRQDINDPLGKEKYVTWHLYPTIDDYWTAQFNQLDRFAAGGGLETPLSTPGIQGIHCNRHVAIQTNDGFFRHRVAGPGVPPLPFHDLLVNWINGGVAGNTTQQIQTDNLGAGLYTMSFCP
jgi:hypothetical protein